MFKNIFQQKNFKKILKKKMIYPEIENANFYDEFKNYKNE
jgi:hypothetical protein